MSEDTTGKTFCKGPQAGLKPGLATHKIST